MYSDLERQGSKLAGLSVRLHCSPPMPSSDLSTDHSIGSREGNRDYLILNVGNIDQCSFYRMKKCPVERL